MTHWKKLTNPDYLGAYALEDGKDMVVTIEYVRSETVTGPDGKREECPVAHFKDGIKPMILNVTNMKTIAKIYGTPFIENWAGKKIQLYVAQVSAFGTVTDALRIREYVPKSEEYFCEICGEIIEPYGKLSAAQLAQGSLKKYGAVLCVKHGNEKKAELEAAAAKGDPLNDK